MSISPPPKKKTVDFGTVDLPECQEQPPASTKNTVDFGTVDLPECQEAPPPKKKRSILAPLTFPNVKNNAGKHKSTKKSVFFLKASPAFGRGRFHPQKKNTDFFVLLCLQALFLTFGKVNGAKIDHFCLGRGRGSDLKVAKTSLFVLSSL